MKTFNDFKRYHNSNHHDGDSHFDERTYKKSNGDDFDCSFVQDCYDHFEAGAASRQAEIDALQKRINNAVDYADGVHSENWQETINTMLHILKGELK